jgi:phenylpropionate dioxygenase-like ring-hydroxylating dioxygenase large terminal subunit
MSEQFVRNAWYPSAWESEIGETPFARTLLGEPVVLFRDATGQIAALVDRCPHRLAPLSLGECVNGNLRCGYHGMQFGGDGACVHIPGQNIIPSGAKVAAYPIVLRYGLVWLWMGAAEAADPALLPQVRRHGAAGWEVLSDGYQLHRCNYRIIVENLMDPAHTTFVHKSTIANPAAETMPVTVEKQGETIRAYRWLENSPPSPFDRQSRDFGDALIDRCQSFAWTAPTTSFVDICAMGAGMPKDDEHMDTGVRNHSYKFLTPETSASTHIFWLHVRNHKVGDSEFSKRLRGNLESTFWEDNEICAAIQREQERTGLRQLTALAIDKAPVMAVRQIEKMIAAEAAS